MRKGLGKRELQVFEISSSALLPTHLFKKKKKEKIFSGVCAQFAERGVLVRLSVSCVVLPPAEASETIVRNASSELVWHPSHCLLC